MANIERARLTCSIKDCESASVARGWCTKHYQRWKAHGNPEALLSAQQRADIGRSSGAKRAPGYRHSAEVKKRIGKANTRHGMSHTPTYTSWAQMISRCTNPKAVQWKWYGGRGITVCERWTASFEAFHLDMGDRPAGKTLDRINPERGYEPGNCRWATAGEQARNRRK